MILGVFTGLTEHGGIQRYGRHAAAVIAMMARDRGEDYRFLGLNDAEGENEIESAGVRFSITGFARNKPAMIRAVLAGARGVRLAYLNHPNLAPLGLALRTLNPAARYIVSTYGTEVWEPLPSVRSFGLQRADRVTAIAKFNAEKVAALQRIAPEKIAIVPCALDPDFAASNGATPRQSPPGEPPILLTVARLMSPERGEYKGVDTVIEAMPDVLAEFPGVRYVVVGDGDDRPRLEKLARSCGVHDRVTFTGAVDHAALRAFYEACEVFVMPSRTEGFGIVFLEAMALGKPVVGGNHGGTPEVWAEGTAGFLVDHGDLRALAGRIKLLMGDSELRARMGAAGRAIVASDFSFARFRQNFGELLD
ncbi:MAG TPA: glycosyltransferase family 4 protein [Candidatus Acidoferrum sp.]|nr:glycosyltransferase family 4 protein [Candidatus Acidoferrum sp.]